MVRLNDPDPFRLAFCQCQESLPDPLVKVQPFRVQPIAVAAFRQPGRQSLDRAIEQQRQIRRQAFGSKPVEPDQVGLRQTTGYALVYETGIGKSVGDHRGAACKRRPDQLRGMLGPGRHI